MVMDVGLGWAMPLGRLVVEPQALLGIGGAKGSEDRTRVGEDANEHLRVGGRLGYDTGDSIPYAGVHLITDSIIDGPDSGLSVEGGIDWPVGAWDLGLGAAYKLAGGDERWLQVGVRASTRPLADVPGGGGGYRLPPAGERDGVLFGLHMGRRTRVDGEERTGTQADIAVGWLIDLMYVHLEPEFVLGIGGTDGWGGDEDEDEANVRPRLGLRLAGVIADLVVPYAEGLVIMDIMGGGGDAGLAVGYGVDVMLGRWQVGVGTSFKGVGMSHDWETWSLRLGRLVTF